MGHSRAISTSWSNLSIQPRHSSDRSKGTLEWKPSTPTPVVLSWDAATFKVATASSCFLSSMLSRGFSCYSSLMYSILFWVFLKPRSTPQSGHWFSDSTKHLAPTFSTDTQLFDEKSFVTDTPVLWPLLCCSLRHFVMYCSSSHQQCLLS